MLNSLLIVSDMLEERGGLIAYQLRLILDKSASEQDEFVNSWVSFGSWDDGNGSYSNGNGLGNGYGWTDGNGGHLQEYCEDSWSNGNGSSSRC